MKRIVVLSSGDPRTWDGGDCVIWEGIKRLLPELLDHDLKYSAAISSDELCREIQSCDLLIQAGTPSWVRDNLRQAWAWAYAFCRPIYFLGVGLALHYEHIFPYPVADFRPLKDPKVNSLMVVRGKYAAYWMRKLGVPVSAVLPCPGFYSMDPVGPVVAKNRVVISLPNPNETSKQCPHTFDQYLPKLKRLGEELESQGKKVDYLYQRDLTAYPDFAEAMRLGLPNRLVLQFNGPQDMQKLIAESDLYIGPRNHGALAFAGAGVPSLLLGTDYRQAIADEIPFIQKMNISFAEWEISPILNWVESLSPAGMSASLERYRQVTLIQWEQQLRSLREALAA